MNCSIRETKNTTNFSLSRPKSQVVRGGSGVGKMFTVLSIDGGGIRGIIPATILAFLESKLQVCMCVCVCVNIYIYIVLSLLLVDHKPSIFMGI